MRLSEAIRLGATIRPQCFGDYFKDGGSCAIGAAFEAMGISLHRDDTYDAAAAVYIAAIDLFKNVKCPECGCEAVNLIPILPAHLNDTHRWTRERIADLVEIYELEACLAKGTEVHPIDSAVPVQG